MITARVNRAINGKQRFLAAAGVIKFLFHIKRHKIVLFAVDKKNGNFCMFHVIHRRRIFK